MPHLRIGVFANADGDYINRGLWPPFLENEMTITREQFILSTGAEPVDDDLDRCNCAKAGQAGHYSCGWNRKHNMPVFMVGPEHDRVKEAYETKF